jgi:hypothetical protein
MDIRVRPIGVKENKACEERCCYANDGRRRQIPNSISLFNIMQTLQVPETFH